jgi:hypothetical protein
LENEAMPKVMVVFFGAESPAVSLAEAAADGAKAVRFTEVDLRAGPGHNETTAHRHARLESSSAFRSYDGIVIACPALGAIPDTLDQLCKELEETASGVFTNTVFGVIGGERTTLPGRLSRLGGIMIGEAQDPSDPEARARQLGARVAKVAGWVRHALSHEH